MDFSTKTERTLRYGVHPAEISRPRSPYVFQLQSIRGLAAIVVAFYHATFVFEPQGRWKVIYKAVENLFYGEGAVFTFFILSGFVLGLSLAKHHYYTFADVRLFLMRRFWRLWPAMFVLAFVYAAYGAISDYFFSKYTSDYAIHRVTFPVFISNLTFLDTSLFNHVTWSLGVEWLFSILVPFTYVWTHTHSVRSLILIACTLPLYYFLGARTLHLSDTEVPWCYLFICYAGMALAAFKKDLVYFYRAIPSWLMRLIVCLSVAICVSTVHFGNHLELYTLAMTFMIGAVVSGQISRWVSDLLDTKSLVWLGNVSYSFYLLNPLMLAMSGTLLQFLATRRFVGRHFVVFDILAGICSVGLTLPLAALSFRFLEHPFLRRSAG